MVNRLQHSSIYSFLLSGSFIYRGLLIYYSYIIFLTVEIPLELCGHNGREYFEFKWRRLSVISGIMR